MGITATGLVVLFAFLATFIQRVTGFGFGIVFMSVAPFFMPSYGEATALSGMLALVCAIGAGIQLFKSVNWKKLAGIMLTFLIVSFFAVELVAGMDSRHLKHILGGILIIVSAYFFLFNGKIKMKPTLPVQISMGTISGMMGGLFGMQGPPAVIYFISCTDKKEEYMALTQWYFIIGNIAMTCYRAGNGFLTPAVGKAWLTGVAAVLLGLYLGGKVYDKLNIKTVRKFVYIFICIAGIVALSSCNRPEPHESSLAEGFAQPAKEYYPRVWWHWMNGNVTKEGIRKDLEWMDRAGIAGFQQFNCQLMPTDVIVDKRLPLFSEEWKDAFRYALELADSLGMEVGLAASPGWSITGGPWVKPEDSQKKLCWRTMEVHGGGLVETGLPEPYEFSGPLQDTPQFPDDIYKYRFYEDIAVLAIRKEAVEAADTVADWKKKSGFEPDFRVRTRDGLSAAAKGIPREDIIDISASCKDGRIRWNAPDGDWLVYRFGYNLLGRMNGPVEKAGKGLEADKLSREAMSLYYRTYLDLMSEASGGRLGSVVKYLTIDSYEAGKGTWTPLMPQEFKHRRGYSVTPWLPALTGLVIDDGESTDEFLMDWKATLGELLTENHYDLAADILEEYGMGFYAESHESGTAFIGDGMMPKRRASVPMGAIWVNFGNGVYADNLPARADIKESSSVAHIYGQNICAAESFSVNSRPTVEGHFPAYQCCPANLKRLADAALSSGLNRFVMHCSPHQPLDEKFPGLGLGSFGNWFNRHDTWAEEARPWHDYLARNCYMLQQGRFCADIALLYPEDDNATGIYRRKPVELPYGYDFDLVNSDIVQNMTGIDGKELVTKSGMRYKVLLVDPEVKYYSVPLLRKLARLAKAGVVISASRPEAKARLSDSAKEYGRLVRSIWDSGRKNVIDGWRPEEALAMAGARPQLSAEGAVNIRFVHRRTDDAEIFFLANVSPDQVDPQWYSFDVAGLKPRLWNAEDGSVSDVLYRNADDRTEVRLSFHADDACFIVFQGADDGCTVQEQAETEPRTGNMPLEQWAISFQQGRGAPADTIRGGLSDWAESGIEGIRHFSGTAEYVTTVEPGGAFRKATLQLGEVQVMAHVFIDGEDLGLLWHKPYEMDITEHLEAGRSSELKLRVTNLWPNRMIGDAAKPKEERITYTPWQFYQKDSTLLPSGLIGPASIEFLVVD